MFPSQPSALVQFEVLPREKAKGLLLFSIFPAQREGCPATAILPRWKVLGKPRYQPTVSRDA